MARYRDLLPSQRGWIHDLARSEVHPEAERLLQLGRSDDPQQLVEESTVEFLTQLREAFTEYLKAFNAYSENAARFAEVKIYSIAQTASDFMVFRNQIKLLVANSAHGVIQVSFAQHVRGALAVDGQVHAAPTTTMGGAAVSPTAPTNELLAQIGPFRDVYWTFQGEKVEPAQVAKFYFAEFVRVSRDSRKTKAGNQVLLDQIKALLQEKGLDL